MFNTILIIVLFYTNIRNNIQCEKQITAVSQKISIFIENINHLAY